MIISASRRTDIPACFSKWFFKRMEDGYCLVRNPYNDRQISRIDLVNPDGIVFWTKNPGPILPCLPSLSSIPYYFQFTATSYGRDIERNIPEKNGVILPAFRRLADMIGPDRIIWRYDPILLTKHYDIEWHLKYFGIMCKRLEGCVEKCVASFLDPYQNIVPAMRNLGLRSPNDQERVILLRGMLEMARKCGIELCLCSEDIEMEGIGKSACIDAALLSRIAGKEIPAKKDAGQRKLCGCAKSRDIGMYGTCGNCCVYCYAMAGQKREHDPDSPFLAGSFFSEEERSKFC